MLLWDERKKERMNKNEFMLSTRFRYIGNEIVWGFGSLWPCIGGVQGGFLVRW